jgi:hypothetical protein
VKRESVMPEHYCQMRLPVNINWHFHSLTHVILLLPPAVQ